MSLNREIAELLGNAGCKIFGFADLSVLPAEPRKGLGSAVVMGRPYIIPKIGERLDDEARIFLSDTGTLDDYQNAVKVFLKQIGYKASTSYLTMSLTFKTLATLAGIGWIGKNAMLVTEGLGPALRLTAVLTNAPFEYAIPITKSLCPPDCTYCADICPVNAISGKLWEYGIHRDEFFDVSMCKKGRSGKKNPCGAICIMACPLTMKGLGYEYE